MLVTMLYRLVLHSVIALVLFSSTENCIDGVEFLLLKDAEVHKMVPQLGMAKKIIRLILRDSVEVNYIYVCTAVIDRSV